MPKEVRRQSFGYSDWDDPESYGNSAYGGGRYATNDDFGGRRTSFGGGYSGSSYGGSSYQNSAPKRSAWNGNTYGSGSYGSASGTTYGSRPATKPSSSSGVTYGGVNKLGKPAPTGNKDLSAFKIGVRVEHTKFGVGTIVGVRGAGSNMIVDVAFENGLGIKQLSASLAPLTIKNV